MYLSMAFCDFIPVVLFFISSCYIMHDIYHLASKGAFSLTAAGFILVSCAGLYKAVWKLLYTLQICNFEALNETFFPMQSTGFMLAGIGMMALHVFSQKEKKYALIAVPLYTSSFIFVLFTILGDAGIFLSLILFAKKIKKPLVIIMLIISFVLMMEMGYLSSRDFTEEKWNWIGEGINTVGQLLLLISVKIMHKYGFERLEMQK